MVKIAVKKAFTIAELTISLIIIGLFLLLATNIVVKSTKTKTTKNLHGYYACYYDKDGNLMELMHTYGNSYGPIPPEGGRCTFTTPKFAKYLIMNLIGGGAGSNNKYAGQNGEFISKFVSLPDNKHNIVIGEGGEPASNTEASQNGGDTVIYIAPKSPDPNNPNNLGAELFRASGGHALYSPENLEISDISKCAILPIDGVNCFVGYLRSVGRPDDAINNDYVCDMTPNCEIVGDSIKIDFCGYKSTPRSMTIPFRNYAFDSCTALDMDKIYSKRLPWETYSGVGDKCERAIRYSMTYKDHKGNKGCISKDCKEDFKNQIKNGADDTSVHFDDADDLFTKVNLDIAHDKLVRKYYQNRLEDGIFTYYDFVRVKEDLSYVPDKAFLKYGEDVVSFLSEGDDPDPSNYFKDHTSRHGESYWCDARSSFDVYFYLNQSLSKDKTRTKMQDYIELMEYDIANKETIGQGAAADKNGGYKGNGGGIIINW